MKKLFGYLFLTLLSLILSGCASSSPEYYEELSETERISLQHAARALALRGNAVPGHLRNAFVKLSPYERIVYDGDKRGKATYRWEIYENRASGKNIRQEDINPYWVMVYAIGDLRDPSWKLNHANEDRSVDNAPVVSPGGTMPFDGSRPRQIRKVRYKR